MKIFKQFALALCFAASIGAVSTSVLAEGTDAIDIAAGKVGVAIEALTKGESAEQVSGLIQDALDASKEINVSDKVFVARTKSSNKLKAARAHLKEGATQEAEQELRDAQKGFLALKDLK